MLSIQQRSGAGAPLGLRSPSDAPSPTPSALDRHTMISPADISPLHPIRDPSRYVSLCLSMEKDGWKGRPLLAAIEDGCVWALTGSHRIQAARDSHVDAIPVYVIDGVKLASILAEMGVTSIDPKISREALRRYGDETAIQLFAKEKF